MPFTIVRNDITNMAADAIVNTANPRPVIGQGTDSCIHEKAGPQLLVARQKIGAIQVGCSAITKAYNLQAKYVIHTVGPVWLDGNHNEEALLRSCYDNALKLAVEHRCKSIAFPLISSGNYGFPKDKALQIAISAFSAFLPEHEIDIFLVVFDRETYRLSEKLFVGIQSYIDEHYVDQHETASYSRRIRLREKHTCDAAIPLPCAPTSLQDMLKKEDAGFTETLLQLIDRSGHKDSYVYKRANLSKQHFSKIRNDLQYKPKKTTAVALAIALELDLEKTNDLIGRAGYTLSFSNKFDLIIRYFIEKKQYDINEINIALYEFDQPLLGA